LLVVTEFPAIPYHFAVANPGFPYTFEGYETCASKFGNAINGTNQKAFDQCLAQYIIPPINVTGYGSFSFNLLAIGREPFPALLTVGEPNFYAVLHIRL
jgi:hypothetical protein